MLLASVAMVVGLALCPITEAGGRGMSAGAEKDVCIGHHRIVLPAGASATVTATYAGLRVVDEGVAKWGDIESSLNARAGRAKSSKSPRSARAEAIYRAAGGDPDKAFATSGLVGFDVSDQEAMIAEHVNKSSEFAFEAHRLYDGRHFVFQGKHNEAGSYASVRDGVKKSIERFTPLPANEIPQSNGFCTGNGVFAIRGRHDVGGDAQLYVTFPAYPGLKFSLNLYGLVERSKEPSFMERVGRDLAELGGLGGNVRTLHRGSREYGGQKGQLVAISMPLEDGGSGHAYKYFWHADGELRDPFRPEVEAEMMTETDASSVDVDTIEALWQQIMGSLQARGP